MCPPGRDGPAHFGVDSLFKHTNLHHSSHRPTIALLVGNPQQTNNTCPTIELGRLHCTANAPTLTSRRARCSGSAVAPAAESSISLSSRRPGHSLHRLPHPRDSPPTSLPPAELAAEDHALYTGTPRHPLPTSSHPDRRWSMPHCQRSRSIRRPSRSSRTRTRDNLRALTGLSLSLPLNRQPPTLETPSKDDSGGRPDLGETAGHGLQGRVAEN